MKKLILLLALITISQSIIYSQVWAPVGAKWTYSDVSMGWEPFHNLPTTIECTGDTIIDGKSCRIFTGGCECSFSPGIEFLYYEDDKVYYYVDSVVGFTMLYDFSAMPGETWTCIIREFWSYDTTIFEVVGIGNEIIGDDTIPFQSVKNSDDNGNWQWGGKVYKYIGDYSCFYPQYANADPWTGPIRCYEDSTTFIKFQDIPCDTSIFHMGVKEHVLDNSIKIFPNPATSFITINVKEGIPIEEAIIYNHLGQNVLVAKPRNNTVDVSGLTPGIYYLEVITSESRAGTKLVIE
jgi:hypothetical protein